MISAERADVYCLNDDDHTFAMVVRDGNRSIVVKASASSISPRVGYDEMEASVRRFADRIAAAINKGGNE